MDADIEAELDRERENADRLHAVLQLVIAQMRSDERDDLRAVLLVPHSSQLTVGQVLDGALAMHDIVVRARPQ